MDYTEIESNVKKLKAELARGNSFGERITLVAATKTQSVSAIEAAISAGVDAVAENKVQEFREKSGFIGGCPQHFIGHLQTNKVKYLVGKIALFHSCDRDELASALSSASLKKGVVSDVLIQVNIGKEETKGGYLPERAYDAFKRLSETPGLCVKGFMAMLPESQDEGLLGGLADDMRALYEKARKENPDVCFLSMGMSGDYRLCIAHGSNMIRVGSTIFGARDYGAGSR